jgi:hypothetical protein
VAEALGIHIHEFLGAHAKSPKKTAKKKFVVSGAQKKLAQELQKLAQLSLPELQRLSTQEFLRGWQSLLNLFPHLHPANATEHGKDIEEAYAQVHLDVICRRRYSRSGWPVALELIGREAWRRRNAEEFGDDELYAHDAVSVGMANSCSALPSSSCEAPHPETGKAVVGCRASRNKR